MSEIAWVTEYGDADKLLGDRSVVVDPIGRLAPGSFIGLATAVDDFSTQLRVNFHCSRHANGKRAFFGVTKGDVAITCRQLDRKVDPPRVVSRTEFQGSLVVADAIARGVEPIVGGYNRSVIPSGGD